jgi:hypothetical protein
LETPESVVEERKTNPVPASTLKLEMRGTTFTMILIIFFLVYPSCSNKILATFSCKVFDDGTSVILKDPSLSCSDAVYSSYAVYAGIMTVLYPVGIPVVYSILLYRERKQLNPFPEQKDQSSALVFRENNPSIFYLRFLWRPYKTHYFWFGRLLSTLFVPPSKLTPAQEVFELLRKLAQTSVVVFVSPGSSPQIVFQLLVTMVSIVVLNSLMPYLDLLNSFLALIAQWAIFGIALTLILINFNDISDDYDAESLGLLMVYLFFIVPVTALVIMLYRSYRMSKSVAEEMQLHRHTRRMSQVIEVCP